MAHAAVKLWIVTSFNFCNKCMEQDMKLLVLRWKGFYKYRNLFKQLVFRDIKLKYRRSILGYLWSVLNPLFVMLIMVIVFSSIFRSDVENFPLYLLS